MTTSAGVYCRCASCGDVWHHDRRAPSSPPIVGGRRKADRKRSDDSEGPGSRHDMDHVRHAFVQAARMAIDANFDMLELHCAHGYLLSSFITPLSNHRQDEYGGSLENRVRFPVEVFAAIREVWPRERPMSVRISATDWVNGGVTGDDAVRFPAASRDFTR